MAPRKAPASISVDLDSLHHYCRIHSLPESLLDERSRRLVHEVAVPRYLELFRELGAPGTFFVIGEDVAQPGAAEALAQSHREGVELGNHSFSHDYALSRRTPDEIDRELSRGEDAIFDAVGERPVGFRAPGYTLTPALHEALQRRGYRYDSSAFSAVPYWTAKALVMGALAVTGKPSRAVLDSPRVLLAPTRPYFPSRTQPYARGDADVLQLPITCAPVTRFPFIGTFAVTLPRPAVRALYATLRREPLFNFELHAVDVLSVEDGIPRALAQRQRDLFVPVRQKLERLREVFSWLRDDYALMPLRDAAERLR